MVRSPNHTTPKSVDCGLKAVYSQARGRPVLRFIQEDERSRTANGWIGPMVMFKDIRKTVGNNIQKY